MANKTDMTYIFLYSKDLVDVAAFIELMSFFIEPEFPDQGKGQKSAAFKLSLKKDSIKLKQDLKQDIVKNLLKEIQDLKQQKTALLEELSTYQPKQDLSVNEGLKSFVALLRNEGISYQKIADALNKDGYRNSRNNLITAMQASRLFKKYTAEKAKEY